MASLFSLFGGIVMLAAGATDTFVRWSAGQAIVLWFAWLVAWMLVTRASSAAGFPQIHAWIYRVLDVAFIAALAYSPAQAFLGKKARLPGIASLTERMLTGTIR